jgi:predicted TIM-barrel fold metal-dependent hydrolase
MQIVDAQIHLWGSGLPSNQSHIQVTHFTPEEAIPLMDAAGVAAAVIHPPGWDPNSTAMAFKAVRDYPGRFAILGSLPLDRPDTKERIAGWRAQPGMLGLRYTFLHDPARQQLADGTLDWLWAAAEKAEVPIAMLATDSLTEIGRIAERHPGLRLTIDHLGGRGGLTTLKDHAAMTHLPQLLALAKYPNVAVKATGAPGYSAEAYPYPVMQSYLRRIYDAFGPHRTFWGTDITKMPCSWRQCVTMFTEELAWLEGRDLELVMGDAVCAWWGWNRNKS